MAFTRFHDDPARIQKSLEESTFTGKYHLNTPGNGVNLPYINDPHIRLQKWGANLRTNTIGLENDLRNMTRKLNRDDKFSNNYEKKSNTGLPMYYQTNNKFEIDETRASLPAWTFRDKQQYKPNYLFYNPQEHTSFSFDNNLQTRILEKDYYKSKYY